MKQHDEFEERHISGDEREILAKAPPELRPCKIMYFYVRYLVRSKRVPSWEAGIGLLAEKLAFSRERVMEIVGGFAPTYYEIDTIARKMGWSIFFLFGIRKEALNVRSAQFFSALGVGTPTRKLQKEFIELYMRLLKSRVPQEREVK